MGSEDIILIKSMCEGLDHLKKRNQSSYIKKCSLVNVHWFFHNQMIVCCLTSFVLCCQKVKCSKLYQQLKYTNIYSSVVTVWSVLVILKTLYLLQYLQVA